MSDLIDREAVREFIKSYRHSTDVAFDMEKRLDEIPAASSWHRVEDIADKTNKGPIVPFSARMWVEREFIKWCEENNVAKVGNALVVFMLNHDWINRDKLVKDYRNRDKEDA